MDSKQLLEIQTKLYDIIEYFDNFCKENNITYYLAGGNAIGAMRHQGFIPWDDDFDVYMMQNDYIKFISLAEEKLDTERFYLQKENTKELPLFFSKLRMNGTTYWETDTKGRKMHKGFYMDIFCMYKISSNPFMQKIQYLSSRFLTARTLYDRGYKTNNLLKKGVMFFSGLFVRSSIKKILIYFVNYAKDKKVKYVANLFGGVIGFKQSCIPIEYFGKPRYVKYGHLQLPVSEKIEEHLTQLFGDYMAMPSEETKSRFQSHVVFYDTEKDYKYYEGE